MDAQRTGFDEAAEQLITLTMRALWVLYVVFWLTIVIYGVITIGLSAVTGVGQEEFETLQTLPQSWTQWQFLFAAVGLACIYLQFRLGMVLLRPERLWQGTRSLGELAAHLRSKRASRSGSEGTAAAETPEQRHQALTQAVQHLLGRIVFAHLILWLIAEVPALLGLVDRFVSGGSRLVLGLLLLSVIALVIRRPTRARVEGILQPILKTG